MSNLELLSTEEMARADQLASDAYHVASLKLMEMAGVAVADAAEGLISPGALVLVLCGPGNNGGDGFVAARHLKQRGYQVVVALLGDQEKLKGDAAHMAGLWQGDIVPANAELLAQVSQPEAALIIDALFGAGFSRDFDDETRSLVKAVARHPAAILSVDVPSGVNGSTGEAVVDALAAQKTVTFFRRKPGHMMFPGRALCGETKVVDIGIPDGVLETIAPQTFSNAPGLWGHEFPKFNALKQVQHKYNRGHVVVVSGPPSKTGAARLGARAALRVGSGLVTVAGPRSSVLVNAAHLTAVMVEGFDLPDGFGKVIADPRRNAVLIGPGCGVGAETQAMVLQILQTGAGVVLDADALTSFAEDEADRETLFAAIKKRDDASKTVMTPHDGEFAKLFAGLDKTRPLDKLFRAREAAVKSGSVVVLKGADTVVAAPDGRAAINDNAPPWLATAGSGDVLAGFITGLLAQGMPAWEAACAGVWLHGAAASAFGPGLIAEDLPDVLPSVLQDNAEVLFGL